MSKLSRARPAPTFVLLGGAHASGTCVALRKLKMQFSIALIVPEGRWPGLVLPQVADSPTWFLGGSVWLLSWGIATTLPVPPPAAIAALSHLLCQRLWKGTLELLFHWGKQSWPLDAVGHPCLQDQLDEWGILPATPCSRISLFSSAGPRRSWLGFLLRERPPPPPRPLPRPSPVGAPGLGARLFPPSRSDARAHCQTALRWPILVSRFVREKK